MSKRTICTYDGKSPRGEARTVKVRFDSDYQEYICEVSDAGGRRASADYFTSDRDDALRTARDMCGLSLAAIEIGEKPVEA